MSSSSFITLAVTRLATQSVHITAIASHNPSLFLPAGRTGPKITLRFPHLFVYIYVFVCVCLPYHVRKIHHVHC